MQRRKFLIGAGSIATGTAAAMGTGAFTSVTADRSVNVTVADDSSALLAIRRDKRGGSETPNAKEYVNNSGNAISLDFTGTDSNAEGINDNATTVFDDLLTIENQGTQGVYVGYTAPPDNGARTLTNAGFALYHEDSDYRGPGGGSNYDANAGNYNNDGQLNIDTAPDEDGDGNPDLVYLGPGDQLKHVGAYFFGSPDVSTITSTSVLFKAADEFSDL